MAGQFQYNIRKISGMLLAASLCLSGPAAAQEGQAEGRKLDVWVCNVPGTGGAGALTAEHVRQLADDFEQSWPEVTVEVTDAGEMDSDQITQAVGSAEGPDVILSSPEQIVTGWAGSGLMQPLDALWDEDAQNEINGEVREACKDAEGTYYMVPLCRDLYVMAINYDLFRETAAIQYLDENAHSWRESGFIDCILGIYEYSAMHGDENKIVGKVCCRDGSGARAFMSFITNFCNSALLDDMHTSYTISAKGNRTAFGTLRRLKGKGIEFDPQMNEEDEIQAFVSGDLGLTFHWSAALQEKYRDSADFTICPMMYPNSKNLPVLTGPVCGFGIPAGNDQQTEEDAEAFVRFLTGDAQMCRKAAELSGFFPVRRTAQGKAVAAYAGDADRSLFSAFMEYFGDYCPVMPLFDELEEAWPEMVRKIGKGSKIKNASKELDETLNTKLEEEYGITAVQDDEELQEDQ